MNAHFYLLLLRIKLWLGSSKHLVVVIFHLGAIKPLQDFNLKFKKIKSQISNGGKQSRKYDGNLTCIPSCIHLSEVTVSSVCCCFLFSGH